MVSPALVTFMVLLVIESKGQIQPWITPTYSAQASSLRANHQPIHSRTMVALNPVSTPRTLLRQGAAQFVAWPLWEPSLLGYWFCQDSLWELAWQVTWLHCQLTQFHWHDIFTKYAQVSPINQQPLELKAKRQNFCCLFWIYKVQQI